MQRIKRRAALPVGDVGIAGLRPPGGNWRDVLEMAALVDGLGYSCVTTGEAWGQGAD